MGKNTIELKVGQVWRSDRQRREILRLSVAPSGMKMVRYLLDGDEYMFGEQSFRRWTRGAVLVKEGE